MKVLLPDSAMVKGSCLCTMKAYRGRGVETQHTPHRPRY